MKQASKKFRILLVLFAICLGVSCFSSVPTQAASTPAKSKIKQVQNVETGLKVKWKKIAGVKGYILYRQVDSGKLKKLKTFNNSTVSYLDTSVKNGKRYSYAVKTYVVKKKKTTTSKLSGKQSCMRLEKPKKLSVTKRDYALEISWSTNKAAYTNEISIRKPNGTVNLFSTKNNHFTYQIGKTAYKDTWRIAVRHIMKLGDASASVWSITSVNLDQKEEETKQDESGTDTPGTDLPGTDTPGTDTPGTDTPGTETPEPPTPPIGTDDHTHNYVETILTPATCFNTGSKAYICSICGKWKDDRSYSIPKTTNHQFAWTDPVPATCTTPGKPAMYRCTVCGLLSGSYSDIPATGHHYTEQIVTPTTCISDGTLLRTCKDCGIQETITIPATGHQYLVKEHTIATCTTDGTCTYECQNCHDTYTETVAKAGHRWAMLTERKFGFGCGCTHYFSDEEGNRRCCNFSVWGPIENKDSDKEIVERYYATKHGYECPAYEEEVAKYGHYTLSYQVQGYDYESPTSDYVCLLCGAHTSNAGTEWSMEYLITNPWAHNKYNQVEYEPFIYGTYQSTAEIIETIQSLYGPRNFIGIDKDGHTMPHYSGDGYDGRIRQHCGTCPSCGQNHLKLESTCEIVNIGGPISGTFTPTGLSCPDCGWHS